MRDFAFGTQARIFLNIAIGCNSACSYCYLPDINFVKDSKMITRIPAKAVYHKLVSMSEYVPGRQGSLLSIGCYSECWDRLNLEQTRHLLKLLLPLGNPIQIATKRKILNSQIHDLLALQLWQGQLSFFVSSATITNWDKLEQKTPPPHVRFAGLALRRSLGAAMFLYIKPVIPAITFLDAEKYLQIAVSYSVPIVVGGFFSIEPSSSQAPVGHHRLFTHHLTEVHALQDYFSRHVLCYIGSQSAIDELRS